MTALIMNYFYIVDSPRVSYARCDCLRSYDTTIRRCVRDLRGITVVRIINICVFSVRNQLIYGHNSQVYVNLRLGG